MKFKLKNAEQTYDYRPITTLAKWTNGAVYLAILSWVISIGFGVYAIHFFRKLAQLFREAGSAQNVNESMMAQLQAWESQINSIESWENIISLLESMPFILSMIMVGCWINRSHKNARALGVDSLEHSPAWAVGSFFVPIVSLFVPYRAMKELFSGSLKRANQLSNMGLLGWWWFAWLTGTIIGRISSRMIDHADQAPSDTLTQIADNLNVIISAMFIDIIALILMVISAICLLKIMKHINQAHQQIEMNQHEI